MFSISSAELLRLWEAGTDAAPAERAILVAEAAVGLGRTETATQPVGLTAVGLLEAHRALGGDRLAARITCPDCDTEVGFELAVEALLALAPEVSAERVPVDVGDHHFRVRSPGYADLVAVSEEPDAATALAARCAALPLEVVVDPEVFAAIEAAIEHADPLAEVRAELSCVQCGRDFDCTVDITAHAWSLVDARARRLLAEVDALAFVYGWSEHEILGLSAARRAGYLALVEEAS